MRRDVGIHQPHVDFEKNQDDSSYTKRGKEDVPIGNQLKRLEYRKVIVGRILGAYIGESHFG